MIRANRTLGRPGANSQDAPVLLQDLAPHASTSISDTLDLENNPPRASTTPHPTNTSQSPSSVPVVHNSMSNTPFSPADTQDPPSISPPLVQVAAISSPHRLNHTATAQTVTTSPTSTAPHQHLTNLSFATFVPSNNPPPPNRRNRLSKFISRMSIPPTPLIITRLRQYLRVPTVLLITLLLFTFVTLVSWQAHNLDWPLARIPIPSGILLLTIVAKFTDWALAGVTDDAWERLRWGPVVQQGRENLLTFLVMGSGFGVWWKVLFSSAVQPGEETRWGRVRRLLTQKWRWRMRFGARFWSFARIFIWVFVQFPGLILMAMIENQDSFQPSGWTEVTGGLGMFNASLGWLQPADPAHYRHVLSILQDPAMTVLTAPISERCTREKSCQSYLLSGGVGLLQPWPYRPRRSTSEHVYMVRNIPAYQVDVWETSFNSSLPYGSWGEDQCRVFVGGSGERHFPTDAIQVCAKRDGDDGRLLAGIRACAPRALDETGNCTLETKYPGWHSFPAFTSTIELYRVQADMVFDRHSGSIMELSSKHGFTQHNVPPDDFLNAFELLLCPFVNPNTTQISRYCISRAVNHMLTTAVYLRVLYAYSEVAFDNESAVDVLRSLFGVVLYLFNPVYHSHVLDGSTPIRPNESASGLPAENTFLGSPAIQSSYVAPATWTVIAFIVSAGLLITTAVLAIILSALSADMPDLNKFPVLDGMKVVVVDPTTGEEIFFGNAIGRKKTRDGAIYAARQTTVRISQREAG
ncbi:hypothetical protein QBC36DRAFT_363107 [Triangularia setosa]|uniref:Uncharacterized protein n=1 Tax=Triangularia setosa TaxID=2587417 RepID=A0AAN6VZ04_9PEZI|nr:hypothetical protein QBC36DRAFT_363107 [Podospora setosa]